MRITEAPVEEAPVEESQADSSVSTTAVTIAEVDNSPTIAMLTVGATKNGMTDIAARVHTPTGYENKRCVIPGGVTARKLCELLADVDKW